MVKIILDTDISGDCDDVAAVALLNYFKNRNEAEILAVTDCVDIDYGVSCIDAICRYYGNTNVDIGSFRGENKLPAQSLYLQAVSKQFPHRNLTQNDVAEAYRLMRSKLAEHRGVKLVCIGILNDLALLLDSPPDDISPLGGAELIRQSVDEIVVMGGIMGDKKYVFEENTYDREFNIVGDIEAAKKVFSFDGVKITVIEFELGYQVLAFAPTVRSKKANPVQTAFRSFGVEKRESWDPIAVLYAVLGTGDLYAFSDWGTVTVQDDGKTDFAKDENGNVRYLIEKVPKEQIVERLNAFDLASRPKKQSLGTH